MGLSPFTKTTAESVTFGAGIIVLDMPNPKAYVGTLPEGAKLIGATSGGSNFSEEIEFVDALEGVDGYSMPVKEAQRIVKRLAKVTTTMKEMTTANLKFALGAADVVAGTTGDTMETIQPRLDIKPEDFPKNLCIIAPILKEGIYAIIEIDNPMNMSGCNMTLANNESGGVELEIQGFGSLENYGEVPYRIHRTKVVAPASTMKTTK